MIWVPFNDGWRYSWRCWRPLPRSQRERKVTINGGLALLHESQGRYTEAEPIYNRSLAIREKAPGPDHPDVGQSLNNLAVVYFVQRDWAPAVDFWRRSTRVIIGRAQRGTFAAGQALTGKQTSEAEQFVPGACEGRLPPGHDRTQLRCEAECRDVRDSAMGAELGDGSIAAVKWRHAAPKAILVLRHSCGSAETSSRIGSNAMAHAAQPLRRNQTSCDRQQIPETSN
jgi:hypothetical protein